MVAMNATGGKTTKMKILDEKVVVVAETNTGYKDEAETGNNSATEGAPQAGPWGE